MRTPIPLFTILFLIAGGMPAFAKDDNAAVLAKAKAALLAELRDPYSAKIETMKHQIRPNVRGEPTSVVCGVVNGKNGFGAYTGSRQFVYMVEANQISILNPATNDNIAPALILRFCN